MRVQQEKDCIKQDAFLPFLSHTCLQKAISHKYEILWADFAGLFALGHLKIKFSKEHFVFLDRGSLKPFLCMRGCFPLIQWGSRNLCLRNLGHNSKGANKQAKAQFMQISSQDGVYMILPAVRKVLWTNRAHCRTQGSSPEQAMHCSRALPQCARSEPMELLLYRTQDSKTHGLKLCWEMGIAGSSARRADKNPLTHTRSISDAFQRMIHTAGMSSVAICQHFIYELLTIRQISLGFLVLLCHRAPSS